MDNDEPPLDLYAELGLDRDATPDEVKAAYRKRAMETHPDRGGQAQDFDRVNSAYLVLSNPKRRRQYDQGGSAEKPSADEELIESLTIIDMKLQQLMAEVFNPERVDMVAKIVQAIGKDIIQKERDITQAQDVIKRLTKLKPRFKAKRRKANYIGNLLKAHIQNAETIIENAKDRIKLLKRAQKIAEGHTFEVEVPPPPPSFYPAVSDRLPARVEFGAGWMK